MQLFIYLFIKVVTWLSSVWDSIKLFYLDFIYDLFENFNLGRLVNKGFVVLERIVDQGQRYFKNSYATFIKNRKKTTYLHKQEIHHSELSIPDQKHLQEVGSMKANIHLQN